MPDPTFIEIPIRGALVIDPNLVKRCVPAAGMEILDVADVSRKFDEAWERGIRVALFTVNSPGGEAAAAFALAAALRHVSAAGGRSVVHVELAASSAALWILGADYVVVAPDASILFHQLQGFTAPGVQPDSRWPAVLAAFADDAVRLVSRTTFVDAETVRSWLAAGAARIVAKRALRLGYADFVGGVSEARKLADRLGRGELVESDRRTRLAGKRDELTAEELETTAIRWAEISGELAYGSHVPVVAVAMFMLNVLGSLIEGRGPEDDEDPLDWVKRKMIAAPLTVLPFFNEAAPLVEVWAADESVRGKLKYSASERAAPAVSSLLRLMDSLGRAVDENADDSKRFWAAYELLGLALGLPVSQVKRTGQYLGDLEAGENADVWKLIYGDNPRAPQNPGEVLGLEE